MTFLFSFTKLKIDHKWTRVLDMQIPTLLIISIQSALNQVVYAEFLQFRYQCTSEGDIGSTVIFGISICVQKFLLNILLIKTYSCTNLHC